MTRSGLDSAQSGPADIRPVAQHGETTRATSDRAPASFSGATDVKRFAAKARSLAPWTMEVKTNPKKHRGAHGRLERRRARSSASERSRQVAVNLGVAINTPFQDAGASYFQSDEGGRAFLLFQSDRPGGFGATDIYQSEILPDGSFAAPILVSELNSTDFDFRPSVRFDGLEIIFSSNRTGSLGGVDLWAATRRSVFEAWSTPINLGPNVNSSDDDQQPYIAGDRQTLYFVSNRPGGLGQLDVYVSRRLRLHP